MAGDLCAVCFAEEGAAVVVCEGCGVSVHEECMVREPLSRRKWTCLACSAGLEKRVCALCRKRGGYLVQLEDEDRWVHAACAIWTPETRIDVDTAQVSGFKNINKARWTLVCRLCKKRGGSCIQCISGRCVYSIHPSCGLQRGVHMTVVETPDERDSYYEVLCDKHKSKSGDPQLMHDNPWLKRLHHNTEDEENVPPASPSPQKAGFSLSRTKKHVDTASVSTEGDLCAVCGNGDVELGNAIVYCDVCGMGVHQACYGIQEIPDDEWLCRPCAAGDRHAECMLCPIKGGALKPTRKGDWVHVVCALWTPEVRIGDPDVMEPILDVDKIVKDRWKLVCSICNVRKGTCIQCSCNECYKAYHPLCARQCGYRMEVSEIDIPKQDDSGDVYPDIIFLSYCPRHESHEFDPSDFFGSRRLQVHHRRNSKHTSPRRNSSSPRRHRGSSSDDDVPYSSKSGNSPFTDASNFWDHVDTYFDEATTSDAERFKGSIEDDPSFIRVPPGTGPPSHVSGVDGVVRHLDDVPMLLQRLGLNLEPKANPSFPHRKVASRIVLELVNGEQHCLAAVDMALKRTNKSKQEGMFNAAEYDVGAMEIGDVIPLLPEGEEPPTRIQEELGATQEELAEQLKENRELQCSLLKTIHGVTSQRLERQQRRMRYDIVRHEYSTMAHWQFVHQSLGLGFGPDADAKLGESDLTVCNVCFNGDSGVGNPIVFCERCEVPVHKYCYGIGELPEDEWFCDPCSAGEDKSRCRVCPVQGGALKVSDAGGYVHLLCALWFSPALALEHDCAMGPVTGVRQALQSRTKDTCAVCHSATGLVTHCRRKGCSTAFHPLCAWFSGYAATYTNGSFSLSCPQHTPAGAGGQSRDMARVTSLRVHASHKHDTKSKGGKQALELVEDWYDPDRCAVCFRSGSNATTKLQRCIRCSIAVHDTCYGSGSDDVVWECERCQPANRAKIVASAKCVLCPRQGGALKRTSDGHWAHVACAWWNPDVSFDRPKDKASIRVPASRRMRAQECSLCRKRYGAAIQCAESRCSVSFHVMCGLFSGVCWFEVNAAEPNFALCLRHTPVSWFRVPAVPDAYRRLLLLRHDLDQARTVMDLVHRREKTKRALLAVAADHAALNRDRASLRPKRSTARKRQGSPPQTRPVSRRKTEATTLLPVRTKKGVQDIYVMDSVPTNPQFAVGARLFVDHQYGAYEAKVLGHAMEPNQNVCYRVHYQGWNRKFDELVDQRIVSKRLPAKYR